MCSDRVMRLGQEMTSNNGRQRCAKDINRPKAKTRDNSCFHRGKCKVQVAVRRVVSVDSDVESRGQLNTALSKLAESA